MSDSNGHNGEPSSPVGDGRAPGGRFGPGNKFSLGNPHAKRVNEIRAELMKVMKPADVRVAATKLMDAAKNGDLKAFAELLDRTIGRPVPSDLEQRLAALEEAIAQRNAEARR